MLAPTVDPRKIYRGLVIWFDPSRDKAYLRTIFGRILPRGLLAAARARLDDQHYATPVNELINLTPEGDGRHGWLMLVHSPSGSRFGERHTLLVYLPFDGLPGSQAERAYGWLNTEVGVTLHPISFNADFVDEQTQLPEPIRHRFGRRGYPR